MTSSPLFTAKFVPIRRLLTCLVWLMGMTGMAAAAERFFGETRIGTQPAIPIHIELQRAGHVVSGIISIPATRFEVDGHGQNTIIGRFHGPGGTGTLNLRIDGDRLEGNFDLGGQTGVISKTGAPNLFRKILLQRPAPSGRSSWVVVYPFGSDTRGTNFGPNALTTAPST